ncbi:hypothetical protein HWV62_41264, partial [Athelia sp. TMB]
KESENPEGVLGPAELWSATETLRSMSHERLGAASAALAFRGATLAAIANERAAKNAIARQAAGAGIDQTDRNEGQPLERAMAREPLRPHRSHPPPPFDTLDAAKPSSAAAITSAFPVKLPLFEDPPIPAAPLPPTHMSAPLTSPSATKSAEKAWRKEKERKAKLRKKLRHGASLGGQRALPIKPSLVKRGVNGLLDASPSAFASEGMAHTRTAYQGLRDDRSSRKVCGLEEMKALGLEVRHRDASSPTPIRDGKGRVIGICVGQPGGWKNVDQDATVAIKSLQKKPFFPKKSNRYRRGNFPALA